VTTMNDLSIQGGRAYATAYASNVGQATAATTAEKPPVTSTTDSISISSQARELFTQSLTETPISADLPVVTPSNGDGIRPPDAPTPPVKV